MNNQLLISYKGLRKSVGIAAILLPVVLISGSVVFYGTHAIRFSISDYYYTPFTAYFTGTLAALGLFLFTYRGYEPRDLYLSKLMSLLMMIIVFNPCHSQDIDSPLNIIHINSSTLQNNIHNISAIIFFLCCSFYSLFLFTKSDGIYTKQKIVRNVIYKTCGIIILIALSLIITYVSIKPNSLKSFNPVIILETIILWSFGFSWLVKGEFIFKDE